VVGDVTAKEIRRELIETIIDHGIW
jgi:hypothetical protein